MFLRQVLAAIMALLVLSSQNLLAEEEIQFYPGIGELQHPVVDDHLEQLYQVNNSDLSQSDLMNVLPTITDIKEQKGRNLCTVFALTAVLESTFIKAGGSDRIDLSEEWLQYLVSVYSPSGGGNGSIVSRNFNLSKKHGISQERFMKYTRGEWSEKSHSREINRYCSGLEGMLLTRCMNGKRPSSYLGMNAGALAQLPGGDDFVEARESATNVRDGFTKHLSGGVVSRSSSIKGLLRANETLTLEINIYYGSWNITSKAGQMGIEADDNLYNQGVVTYPERNSMDRIKSRTEPARHAVQIIGYDDNVVLTYERRMKDGSLKSFSRKGVYYFKNSWGTSRFGRNFRYKGKRIPGLGMISQDFAHEFGQFYSVRYNGTL